MKNQKTGPSTGSPVTQEAQRKLRKAALQNLYRWIRRIPRLTEELNATGYNKYRHCYLKQEVEIIVKYLGEP